MKKQLQQRLENLVGKDYMQKDFLIGSNINPKRVRGSVRMILDKIYTPLNREKKIDSLLAIKLPR